MSGYKIHIKIRRGYDLPIWFKRNHTTLESAQTEVCKLREWAGFESDSCIRELVIKEARS